MNRKFINQMEPSIGKEEKRAVAKYLNSGGWLTEFKETKKFEEMIAQFTGAKHACVVTNGSVSLLIALLALGIGKGDEVIVPNLTMIASANAVLLTGAVPKLVEIDPETICIDLSLVKKALTKKTRAIMAVSINGRSPNMSALRSLCKSYKLHLIEDAAQALGSFWKGKHLGTHGDIGSLSFSIPKIITTGQGGALLTNNDRLIEKIRKIKDFGRVRSGVDQHESFGFNFKFTDIQAVIGIEQMKKLQARVKRKKEIYALYEKYLSGVKGIRFIRTDLSETSPWFIDIFVKNREKLIEFLNTHHIGSRPFYPPVHTQVPYRNMREYKNKRFPVSAQVSSECLWLPSSVTLTNQEIMHITKTLKVFYEISDEN